VAGKASHNHFSPPLLGYPSRVLLCLHDGYRLHAAIVNKASRKPEVKEFVSSNAVTAERALEDIASQFSARKQKLPRKAIVISPMVVSTLLELPVDPDAPLEVTEMSELVRWELEVQYAQLQQLWEIGAILQGRGFMNAMQRVEILRELEKIGELAAHDQNAFAEVAVNMGYLTQDELQECLQFQEARLKVEESLHCGWMSVSNKKDHQAGAWPWQATGIAESERLAWLQGLETLNVELLGLFPLIGSAAAAMSPLELKPSQEQILLEVHQEQIACHRLGSNRLLASLSEVRITGSDDLNAIMALLSQLVSAQTQRIDVLSINGHVQKITQQASEQLSIDAVPIALNATAEQMPEAMSPVLFSAMLGTLLYPQVEAKRHLLLPLSPRAQGLPFWARDELRRLAPTGTALVALLILVTLQGGRLLMLNSEAEDAGLLYSEARAKYNKAREEETIVNSLRKRIDQLESDLVVQNARLQINRDVLLLRRQRVPELLRTLSLVSNRHTLITSIVEGPKQSGFFISGWSYSYLDAQNLMADLTQRATAMQWILANAQVRKGVGPYQMQGYQFNFWLVSSASGELALIDSATSQSVRGQ